MEARCEHCKLDKIVKIVRRINKVDRSFCSESKDKDNSDLIILLFGNILMLDY